VDEALRALLRALPSIDELLARPATAGLLAAHPRPVVVEGLRAVVAERRRLLLAGLRPRALHDEDLREAVSRVAQPKLRPVFNATGVVLHTNLGRAPLAERAVERLVQVARGYCNLELDLDEGERGSRYEPVVGLLRALTGAEDAVVVNNCAAAVLLAFSAMGQGREAIVSRGELVEIGGGFRIPDVMRQSGARVVEVGTTNRTRLLDYERAITADTGLLVKVHRSNFALLGFTEEASTAHLAALARARGVPLFVDLGSGALVPLQGDGLSDEPTVASVVASGPDVVAFSADKLLGGPQAGVLVGRRAAIARLKEHPLNRALRVDKLTVAALEATLELYRDGLHDTLVPTRAKLLEPAPVTQARATALSTALQQRGVAHRVVASQARVGGGSLPLAVLPSHAVVLAGDGAALHERLRLGTPSVVGRVVEDGLWLDVRCLDDGDLLALASAVEVAVRDEAHATVELKSE
jgi:L-seryl-tRNA(Ser) seleniumtransferase